MTPRGGPPILAERFLRATLPRTTRDDILGDLDEIFRVRAARVGVGSARLWYWFQAVTLPIWFLRDTIWTWGSQGWGELRLALRTLIREPGFTLVTVVVLALAMGANTAIYTVVDGVLLEALPYPEPERLMSVGHTRSGPETRWLPSATGLQDAYAQGVGSFESVALYRAQRANLAVSDRAERILMATVTPSLFRVLRVEPVLGRAFTEEEGRPSGLPVAILSHSAWTDLYGGEPEILGRTIRLDGVTREIVGVMGEGFGFPMDGVKAWVPLPIDPADQDFGGFNYPSIARLRDGATPQTAAAEIQGLLPTLSERFPYLSPEYLEAAHLRADVHPYLEDVVGSVRTALWILMATVGLVLLIACANVANLFLARAEGRQKKVAVRVAIGAGRAQLALRFLAESGILVAAGGGLGVLLAHFGLEALKRFGSQDLPRVGNVGIDASVLAVTGGVMALAAFGFGSIPRFRLSGPHTAGLLRDGGGGVGGRPAGRSARKTLVVSQVALALVLLVASALMVESFRALRSVEPGFRAEGVLTFRVSLPEADYPTWEGAADFHRSFLDRIQSLAGVEAAGAVTTLPLSGRTGLNPISVQGRSYPSGALPPVVQSRAVTPGYFRALGIPLLAGRMMNRGDDSGRTGAVLLSHAVVDAVFPGEDPLGAWVVHGLPDSREGRSEVVGIVGDVRDASLTQEPMGILYFALHPGRGVQKGWLAQDMSYAVRTSLAPLSLLPAVRDLLREMDATLPLAEPGLMEELVRRSRAEMAFSMFLVAAAGGLGLLLSAVGLFGVVSYLTAQRTREMGVRVALGAKKVAVRRLVLRQGLGVTGVGLIIGIAAALVFSRFMESLLFGVKAGNPILVALVALFLGGVSLVATWIPANRATRVDPVEALRSE